MTTQTMEYPTGTTNAPTPSWAKAPPPPPLPLPVRTTMTTSTPDIRVQQQQQQRRPTTTTTTTTPTPGVEPGVDRARAVCEFSVGEYAAALRAGRRYGEDAAGAAARQRAQQDAVVHELRALRRHVDALSEAAAAHRWRRWLVGGIVASIIPIVRRFFRRRTSSPSSSSSSSSAPAASNATEHAFARSKSLIARILASVRGRGALASVAFFVLAVLYVFANEVSLRVARTVGKRLRRLTAKVERGDAAITDKDMRVFQGWRWRVLTWTE